jgi:trehalose 6-phosphate synthase
MSAEAVRKRRQLDAATVLVGVDRLDYTKGIAQRIEAFGELLDEGHLSPDECVLVQVAVPSRVAVDAYCEEQTQVEAAVRAVNDRHARSNGSDVVIFLHQNLDAAELASWYRAANVMLVTPLADGMNLVAKEFVASRNDLRGALVLSEFAGAAQEFAGGAELVNPYDTQSIKDAILRSINAPSSECESKMSHMRSVVAGNDVDHWAASFLEQLDAAAANRQSPFAHHRSVSAHNHRAGRIARETRFEVR